MQTAHEYTRYFPGEPEDHDEHVMLWLEQLTDEQFSDYVEDTLYS